jgi:hypothetical protein
MTYCGRSCLIVTSCKRRHQIVTMSRTKDIVSRHIVGFLAVSSGFGDQVCVVAAWRVDGGECFVGCVTVRDGHVAESYRGMDELVRAYALSVSGALLTHPRLTPVLCGVALALGSRKRRLSFGHLPGVSIPAAE